MKWHVWSKWPLLGVAITAAVLAAPPDPAFPVAGKSSEGAAGKRQPFASVPPPASRLEHGRGKQAGPQVMRVELERLKQVQPEAAETEKTDVANAFNPVSWYEPPPPPPPEQPMPEPPPTAPPVPFVYFGRYEDPPKLVVMLARNEEVYTVSEGDVIDETYRVERIADGVVDIVYLPLGINQTISMGAQ